MILSLWIDALSSDRCWHGQKAQKIIPREKKVLSCRTQYMCQNTDTYLEVYFKQFGNAWVWGPGIGQLIGICTLSITFFAHLKILTPRKGKKLIRHTIQESQVEPKGRKIPSKFFFFCLFFFSPCQGIHRYEEHSASEQGPSTQIRRRKLGSLHTEHSFDTWIWTWAFVLSCLIIFVVNGQLSLRKESQPEAEGSR